MAGVSVFVGHEGPVETLQGKGHGMVAKVAAAGIGAFLNGHDDRRTLAQAIFDAADEFLADGIPLTMAAQSPARPSFFSQAALFDRLAVSLVVTVTNGVASP